MSSEGPSPTGAEWEQRLDAVARLYREAHEKLESDPLSAALRARQAIEHIADYLHTREIGAAARNEILDAKLKRIDAKQIFPRLVATHIGSVQIHTNSVIHPGGMAQDPDPNLLRPCMLSLAIVVEWFFRDYLKRAVPQLPQTQAPRAPHVEPLIVPDATPVNSTISTMLNQGTSFGTGIGEFIPIWRTTPSAHTLRLEAEADAEQKAFKIDATKRTYTIGRGDARSDGSGNDFAVPKTWNSISRDQGRITVTQDNEVVLENTSSNNNVFVRGEMVPKGTARALRHGDSVQLGRCTGTFSDGRYYASAPAPTVDPRTGLLSRVGLVAEISGVLAIGKPRTLFVVRCPEPAGEETATQRDPERLSAKVAMAIHRHVPAAPVARIGMDVALILPSAAPVAEIANLATSVAGMQCASGFITLTGSADRALPQLEGCVGALSRIAIAGRDTTGPEDLTRFALTPTPLDAFGAKARRLFELGGGAVLFALDDLERLTQLAPKAVPVLELELVEMIGARMGPRDIVSFVGPGLILFATPGDAERFAMELGVAWHARGPVTSNALEIDRSLSSHLLVLSDLDNLASRAVELGSGGNAALGAAGLPAPIALAARALEDLSEPADKLRGYVELTELAWKFLAFVLVASGRGLKDAAETPVPPANASTWPAPWRQIARDAALRVKAHSPRVSELANVVLAADQDGAIARALEAIGQPDMKSADRSLARVEKAVREFFATLAPLRGWTLVGVDSAEFVDLDGHTQRVEYVDYTGPSARGSQQRVTVTGFRGLGRFTYLVRWNEGLAIALEPFVRRARNEQTSANELFVSSTEIMQAGNHRYRAIGSQHELELPVTARQIIPTR